MGSWPEVVAVGDVNGDRLDDIVVATNYYFDDENDYSVFIYRQRPDGSLDAPIKYQYGIFSSREAVSLGDLNEDGASDIIVGHEGGLFILLSDGSGGFTIQETPSTVPNYYLALLDLDFDGHLDVVGQSWSDGATLFYGNGRGGFTKTAFMATGAAGYNDIKTGDVTGDGKPDLVVVSEQSTSFYVYPHDGKQKFGGGIAYPSPSDWLLSAVAIGDYDNDGRNEVAVTSSGNKPQSGLYIYRQDESGRLQPTPRQMASRDIPGAMITYDLDRNGLDDILIGHHGWFALGRYMQASTGLSSIEQANDAPFNAFSNGLAAGDFNDDGCTDAAIADYNSGLVTLYGENCEKGRAPNDFNGDGISDLLWHNSATGASVIWKSAEFATQQPVTLVSDVAWFIAGTGDFNGDAETDILWHNRITGASVIWRSGDYGDQQTVTRITDPAWKIAGVGDFDGDKRDDILWRNASTGINAIWKAGNYRTQLAITGITDTLWKIAGVGDFNGDDNADVLWRHASTGKNAVWLSADYNKQKSISAIPDAGWQVAGVADFDGDRRMDILWRHTNGANTLWKSAEHARQERLATQPTRWKLGSIGDFDGNGKSDIVWRNTLNGESVIWRSASKIVTKPLVIVTDPSWAIQ